MFKQITKITGHKSFQNFTWEDMTPMARFNLFYGWNGTGKTTLSNLFSDLEKRSSFAVGEIVFKIDAIDVNTAELGHLHQHLPKIRVFNQRYLDSSVLNRFGNLEHIIFFGEKTVEDEKLREQSQKELDELAKSADKLEPEKAKAIRALDTFKIDGASELKLMLRTSGNDRFANYDKGHFESRLGNYDPAKDIVLNDNRRNELLVSIRTDIRGAITLPYHDSLAANTFAADLTNQLAETPTSVAIQALVQDPQAASWVATGLALHEHRESKNCIFCSARLDANRLRDLKNHFDNSFQQQIKILSMYGDWLQQYEHKARWHGALSQNDVYPHLGQRLKELNAEIENAKQLFLADVAAIRLVVEAKQANPFASIGAPPELATLFERGNVLLAASQKLAELATEHNQITANYQESILAAKLQLISDFVAQRHQALVDLKATVERCTREHTANTKRADDLRQTIQKIADDQSDPKTPAQALNKDIESYLGHADLVLTNHGKGYSIKRGSDDAKDLSEGEKTALALLYFLKSLEDHRHDIRQTIVVIDDPVSSLDSSSIFTAFGFIKERMESAKQLIVLTHNFSFFHLVKGWFQAEQGKKKGTAISEYYSLVRTSAPSGRSSTIKPLDKLLKDFGSEYQYLFSLVKRAAESGEQDLGSLYGMPNVGRRLLEHFIVFKYPGGTGQEKLLDRMKKLGMSARTLAILNRFLNVNSHGDDVAEPEHDLSLLSETSKVMQAIIEVMRAEDKEHVERLEACVA